MPNQEMLINVVVLQEAKNSLKFSFWLNFIYNTIFSKGGNELIDWISLSNFVSRLVSIIDLCKIFCEKRNGNKNNSGIKTIAKF